MKSIKSTVEETITIKNSEFISYLIPVQTVEGAKEALDKIKREHSSANHHCFAYLLGDNQDIQKADDDGEPSQTAGVPILEVFKKNEITNVLCVVVRYFGGIKLGAGGLIRAYTKSASEGLKKATLTKKKKFITLQITFPFDLIGTMEHIASHHGTLINRFYKDKVTFEMIVEDKEYNTLESTIIEATQNQAIINIISSEKIYQ